MELIVDAGPERVGSLLAQPNKIEANVIAYASQSIPDVKKIYSRIKEEMIAVLWVHIVKNILLFLFY